MSNYSAEILLSKTDEIIDAWVAEASHNDGSSWAAVMTYEAVYSRLPHIIDAIAIHLSSSEVLETVTIQVKLGFDVSELLRGFRVLRRLVLSALEFSFSKPDAPETLRKVEAVLDSVTAAAVVQYIEHQLEQSEPMHRALLSSNQKLIRTVQKQKDNASHLAHELKNPLSAIISFSSILLQKWGAGSVQIEDVATQVSATERIATESTATAHVKAAPMRAENTQINNSPTVQEIQYTERILENGRRILALINNMLDTSRRASQKPALNIDQIEISKLIERVVDSLMVNALEKGLMLTADCSFAPPIIHTDSLRLQQILVNLISNAIRYTDQGNITVRCYGVDDEQWAIAVQDTGRGISRSEQFGIFEPYIRAGAEDSHQSDSSGLGLAIVSKLVALLQGSVELVSELGQGSTFTVLLPLDVSESV